MSRLILLTALFGLSAITSGCSGSPASLNDEEAMPNLTMAGPGDAPPDSWPSAEPTPLEPPPALDPWMKVPPMVLEAEATRLLRCGLPQESRSQCNLTFHEAAVANSSARNGGPQRYALEVWVTVGAEVYGTPPTAPFPRAPFRVVHHCLGLGGRRFRNPGHLCDRSGHRALSPIGRARASRVYRGRGGDG